MIKKTIVYDDLDGVSRSEDFYFNLSVSELTDMASDEDNALVAKLVALGESEEGAHIMRLFKDIVGSAIGQRSEDARRFVKSAQITEEFITSEAYNALLIEFITNPTVATDFINNLIPANVLKLVADEQAKAEQKTIDVPLPEEPAYISENRDPTPTELRAMTQEQLVDAMQRKNAPVQVPVLPNANGDYV